jgi:hypothetical protein
MSAGTVERTASQRVYWIDYLRSVNIIATVIFHSFLAYSSYLKNLDTSFIASFPMIDPNTSLRVADLLLLLRPLFSMPLMFYLSGLFVWRGIKKRGSIAYLRYRFVRLIVPLIIATFLIMPLTFAPLAISQNDGILPTSASQIFAILLPADYQLAHLWFLWVLFAFDCIAIAMHQLWNKKLEVKWMNVTNQTIYAILTIAVVITYQLMANIGGKIGWLTLAGPLKIPASQIGLYLVYFFLGVIMGSQALSDDAKTFNIFCITASSKPSIPLGLSAIVTSSCLVYAQINLQQVSDLVGTEITCILINGLYSVSGLLLVISVILIAKRHLAQQTKWLDRLNKDAYGIYIIHFLFVAWIQYLLIDISIPGLYKPILTAIFSIPLSWLVSDIIGRILNYLYFLREIQPDS